jgi:hypothetical protein
MVAFVLWMECTVTYYRRLGCSTQTCSYNNAKYNLVNLHEGSGAGRTEMLVCATLVHANVNFEEDFEGRIAVHTLHFSVVPPVTVPGIQWHRPVHHDPVLGDGMLRGAGFPLPTIMGAQTWPKK